MVSATSALVWPSVMTNFFSCVRVKPGRFAALRNLPSSTTRRASFEVSVQNSRTKRSCASMAATPPTAASSSSAASASSALPVLKASHFSNALAARPGASARAALPSWRR
jgi:hypothetical protein